jgi:hypothetical protein
MQSGVGPTATPVLSIFPRLIPLVILDVSSYIVKYRFTYSAKKAIDLRVSIPCVSLLNWS